MTSVAVSTRTIDGTTATWLQLQGISTREWQILTAGKTPDSVVRRGEPPGADPALYVGGVAAVPALVAGMGAGFDGGVGWVVAASVGALVAAVAFLAAWLRPLASRAGWATTASRLKPTVEVVKETLPVDDGTREFWRLRFEGRTVTLSARFGPVLAEAVQPHARVQLHLVERRGREPFVVVTPGS